MSVDPNYAIAMAMASTMDASGVSQNMAFGDMSSANIMNNLNDMLKKFNGDTKAVEAFLTSYLAFHNQDDERAKMPVGGGLALQAMSQMLAKLKANDVKIDALQKQLDSDKSQTADLAKQLDDIRSQMNFKDLTKHYIGQMWYLPFPIACIAAEARAGAELAILGLQAGKIANKMVDIANDLADVTTKLSSLQSEQSSLLSGGTGKMGAQANVLSGQAQATIALATQAVQLGFLFLTKTQPSNS